MPLKSLQVLLAMPLHVCLSHLGAVGHPPQGAGCGSQVRPPSCRFHCPLPSPSTIAKHSWGWWTSQGFIPLSPSCGQTGPLGNCCHWLPFSSYQCLALSCHLPFPSPPSSSSQRPGAARTKCGALAYRVPPGRSPPIPASFAVLLITSGAKPALNPSINLLLCT